MLDRLIASNAPSTEVYTSDWGDFTLVGRPPPVDGQVAGYAPRRTVTARSSRIATTSISSWTSSRATTTSRRS
jgi:hypothetical protein